MNLTRNEQLLLHSWGYYQEDHVAAEDAGISIIERLGSQHEFHANALRRWQEFHHETLDELAITAHGRHLIVDGDAGPASHWLLNQPRCGVPDILPATAEEANWPEQCRLELTLSFPRGMTLPGLSAEQVYVAMNQAITNVMEDFQIGIRIDQDKFPDTHINHQPARLGGSVLADQYLATNDCNFTSKGRVDNDRRWEYWYLVTVLSHEQGHAYGLRHNRDSAALMYPSINRSALERRGRMNETDRQAMEALGYQRRTSPPPDGGNEIRGRIVVQGDWQPGEYLILGRK